MMSMRSDFLGELQKDEALYTVHRQVNIPPMRRDALFELVSKPAEVLSARFEQAASSGNIANRAAEESTKDTSALPLLSYLLDDMWRHMVERGDGGRGEGDPVPLCVADHHRAARDRLAIRVADHERNCRSVTSSRWNGWPSSLASHLRNSR